MNLLLPHKATVDMTATIPVVLLHPWGLEDVVRADVRRVIDTVRHPSMRCTMVADEVVAPGAAIGQSLPSSTAWTFSNQGNDSVSQPTARGMHRLLIEVEDGELTPSSTCGASSGGGYTPQQLQHVVPLLDAFHRSRLVEQVCLHLWSAPCIAACSELDATFELHKERIATAVHVVLGALRQLMVTDACASQDPVLSANATFHETISDPRRVRFRANAVRLNKVKAGKGSFSSQDLAVHVGTLFYEAFHPSGWGVDMLYHNVEVFVVHDDDVAHCCLSVYPPNLPRVGSEAHPADGVTRELLRQAIACKHFLVAEEQAAPVGDERASPPSPQHSIDSRGTADAAVAAVDAPAFSLSSPKESFKGFVGRPSHFKHDVRCSKGDNAMHPSIASALAMLADVQQDDVVLDPTVGSGTVLLETWLRYTVAGGVQGIQLLGGDMRREYAARTHANLLGLVEASFVSGLLGPHVSAVARQHHVGQDRHHSSYPCAAATTQWHAPLLKFACPEHVANVGSLTEPFRWTEDRWQLALEASRQLMPPPLLLPTQTSVAGAGLQLNGMQLPLRTSSVDVVISDMPFGKRCGSHGINAKLYPSLLKEMHRVLRKGPRSLLAPGTSPLAHTVEAFVPQSSSAPRAPASQVEWWKRAEGAGSRAAAGRCVLLTVEGKLLTAALSSTSQHCPFVLVRPPFSIDMGGLHPYVFVLDAVEGIGEGTAMVTTAPPTSHAS